MYYLSNYLEYIILDKNKTCVDAGAIPLVDLKSCKDGIEQVKITKPDTFENRYTEIANNIGYSNWNTSINPKGCFLINYVNAVYFNPHENGARSEYAQPICKTSNCK